MKSPILVCALLAAAPMALTAATAALAQTGAPVSHTRAIEQLKPGSGAALTVTTPGWSDGGDIAFEYTQYRDNKFPGLTWSRGPAGTKSYAIIMQDIDNARGNPYLHWTMYDIPAGVTALPAGMVPDAKPAGSNYGPNYQGNAQSYLGPKTPPGPKHHYYLQVFALDTTIPADPAITLDTLEGAMQDHVLASGETMGLGQADPDAKK